MKRFVVITVIGVCFILLLVSGNKKEYAEFYNTDCTVVLKIISTGDERDDGTFYICRAIKINDREVKYKTNIRLKVKNDQSGFKYGDVIYSEVKLLKPDEARNPGNFDYEKYLLSINVSAVAAINNKNQITLLDNKPDNILVMAGINTNKKVLEIIRELLTDKKSKMVESILIGNKEYLEEEIKNNFSNAGISHYMSVSGAHAVFFILPFTFILKKINVRKQLRYIIEILLLIFFVSITGFGVPAVRAVIIMVMNRIAFLIRRDNDKMVSVFMALLILMIGNPYVIYSIGTQLSFCCSLSIELITPKIRKGIKRIKCFDCLSRKTIEAISICIAVQIGILPIMINNFGMPSIFTILSNIIAAPIVELIMISGIFMVILRAAGIVFIARAVSYIVYLLGELIAFIAESVSKLSSVRIFDVVYMTNISIVIFYLFLFGLIFIKGNNKRVKNAMIIILAASVFLNNIHFPTRILEIVCIDVGQGDSIFVKTPSGKTWLIDCGSSSVKNVSENRIIPFLKSKGIGKLNFIAVSHTDSDHMSGIYTLLKEFKVDYIIMPDISLKDEVYHEIVGIARENNVETLFFGKGDHINDGDITIKCIHPYYDYKASDANSLSMVLELRYGNFKGLFTGDLEAAEENIMLGELGEYDLLKVAHHGSSNSSTSAFLDVIKPKKALISCSKNNNYGHPGKETLERLKKHTDDIYMTSNCGAVTVRTNGIETRIFEFIKI